ncbi:hypothetical protein StoSoilB13_37080 (plasmid) [Arthrobacter sp. StoSoilB13]|nr:hypothetical protein StoSoilB13_37080 [Arthrobacter sp. StoSoilB13]
MFSHIAYAGRMLLLVDLDNTLVDRTSAFACWATNFVRSLGRPHSDAAWLITADRDGYEPRGSLALAIKQRFRMDRGIEALVDTLLFEHVELMTMDPRTRIALREAREAGWRIGIVTNGATAQQTQKIEHLGIEPYVDCVVISEAVGMKKPDAGIFRLAAQEWGCDLTDGWMVGDHPIADISGGRAARLKTGWVSRGQEWPNDVPPPTLTRRTAAEVIDALIRIDARNARRRRQG